MFETLIFIIKYLLKKNLILFFILLIYFQTCYSTKLIEDNHENQESIVDDNQLNKLYSNEYLDKSITETIEQRCFGNMMGGTGTATGTFNQFLMNL